MSSDNVQIKKSESHVVEDVEKRFDTSSEEFDMSDLNSYDVILNEKMKLINNALDEIGFTWYHFKLFCLSGMGYATDSQLSYIQSTVAAFTRKQFGQVYPSDSESLYAGMLVGALVWGFSADLIGRKLAFNTSLVLSAVFAFLAGTMGNWGTYCLFVGLSAAAYGGNLVLDTTVFLEYLPSNSNWAVTLLATWWGVGQTVATLLGWAFLSYSSCDLKSDVCEPHTNRGWRYAYFVNAAIVLFFALLRIFVVRLHETPKYLITHGQDEEAVRVLQTIAAQYNRPCSLTIEQLQACGETKFSEDLKNNKVSIISQIKDHLKILFQNKRVARSTILLYASWLLLGLAYPLYSNFLPTYLASRGAKTAAKTQSGQYRDNVIPNVAAIGGPLLAAGLLYFFPKTIGHRGTMVIGALLSMVCFFCYTQVKTRAQNLALSSLVYVFIDIYYGCLYAYTPSVLPSAARGTGNAIAFGCTRTMACIVPAIAYFANPNTSVPIWICGAAVGVIGCLSLLYPFEPSLNRVV